jgi:hypothetical protein
MWNRVLLLIGLAFSGPAFSRPAFADSDPRFCPSRPSLGSSACTTEPGQVQLEVSAIDWQRDHASSERDDSVLVGDFQARFGVGPTTEAQIGWTPFGYDRSHDEVTGATKRKQGIGDLTLGLRQNLHNPDGKGLSFGIEGSLTLPTGHTAIGGGDWGAGVDVPISYQLNGLLSFTMTTEADAAVDTDGDGRHFAGDIIATAGVHPTKNVTFYTEFEGVRDLDPSGHTTQLYAAEGVAVKTSKRASLWAEAVLGLNSNSPDLRAFSGLTVLF